MITIYKYPLQVTDVQHVEIPVGAQILKVDEQNSKMFLWALVQNVSHTYNMEVRIIGTGQEFNDHSDYEHLGSVLTSDGFFVWHVFRRKM
jgi:hypothetical protein